MALNQNAHRRNMKSMQTIEELRRNQKKYNKFPTYSTINEMSDYAHDIGEGLSHVNNEKISSVGKTIANNSGDDLKKNLFGFAKDKISSLVNKGKVPNASIGSAVSNVVNNADDTLNVINNSSNITDAANGLSNLANTTNNIANVADTAGDVAKVADTASKASQASSAISKVGNSNPVLSTATGALQVGSDLSKGNYVDAGLNGLAAAANFVPVYGQAISAAIKLGQKVKQMYDKKKQESLERSKKAAEQTTQSSLEELNDTKNEIAQKQVQQQQAIDNGFESETPMTKPSMANITNEFKKEPVGNFAEKGNIDLFNRPVTKNEDGTISTVRSMSFNDGNHEVLIPTVADDGSILSEEDAINNYYQTGNHLGKFNSVEDANKYAEILHNQQESLYGDASTPDKLSTILDTASEIIPKNEGGESQAISGQTKEALPKEAIVKGTMDKVKGLFSKDEGQMTGGAADASTILDMFEDPTVLSDYNKLARERERQRGTLPFKKFRNWLQGDTTSDMDGSVIYDYRSDKTKEKENQKVADSINKEIAKRRQQQPQQPQQPVDQVQTLQGASDQQYVLPPLPNGSPVASPSGTYYNTDQFEIIEPDGTMHPAQQTQQVVQGQVSTTQPMLPTQAQQQASPSAMYKTPEDIKQRIANRFARAKQGYNENSTNGFKLDNVTAQEYQAPVRDENGVINNETIKKDIWNRIGEFAGTGKRVLSNPLAQGAIAGLLYRATGGDSGDSLRFGVDWANDKAKSDFYQKQIDPNASPNVFGGRYTAEDWKTKEGIENAKAQQQYSQALLEEKRKENNIRIQKILLDMQKGSNTTQDPSFTQTLNGILTNGNTTPERKMEALSQLLRNYSALGDDQLKYVKNFVDLYGLDLKLGI